MSYSYSPGSKPLHAVSTINNLGNTQEYSYDNNGNMLSGPDMSNPDSPALRTIGYNSDNMPVSINHSAHGTTAFSYDGGGTRAKKSGPSGTTYYVGAHFEVNGSNEIKYIFAGNQRVAMIKGSGQSYYFHQDHLGSSAVLTDATGVKYQQTDYLPYGAQRGSSAISITNYGFTDQEKDPETGLHNYKARLYDPATALFVTADSIVPDPMSSMAFHRYGYCGGNPLIYTDPSGHEPGTVVAVALIIGAAIGAGNAAIHGGDTNAIIGGAAYGAAMAGFSAGAFNGAGGIIASEGITNPVAQAAVHAAVGAATGAMGAAMTGQDIGQGALIGGLAAGFSKMAEGSAKIEGIPSRASRYVAHMAIGGMAGAMGAVVSGSDPFAAFGIGAAVAAVAYRFNNEEHDALNSREDIAKARRALAIARAKTPFERLNDSYIADKVPFTDQQKIAIGKGSLKVMSVWFGGAFTGGLAMEYYPIMVAGGESFYAWAGTPNGQKALDIGYKVAEDIWGTGQPGYTYLGEKLWGFIND